ncbi:MAG: response regulator [Cyanobacteria bacterium]|nr:response regulator [Cyanobacteriota bacterium]
MSSGGPHNPHGPGHLPIGTYPAISDIPTSHAAMAQRIRELEALCAEVYEAAVVMALPPSLLAKLWIVAARGNNPQGYSISLPDEDDALPEVPLIHRSTQHAVAPPDLPDLPERRTVMVVEDDPAMLDLILKILSIENYELIAADRGDTALDLVHDDNIRPDLLITDLMMPGFSGSQLAESLRKPVPHLRVLYQTGFSDQLFKSRRELEPGASFIEKPFTARGLIEAARLALFDTITPGPIPSSEVKARPRGLWFFLD